MSLISLLDEKSFSSTCLRSRLKIVTCSARAGYNLIEIDY